MRSPFPRLLLSSLCWPLVVAGLGGVALLLAAPPAAASVVRRLGLPDLVGGADAVVLAQVIGQKSRWDAARRTILTEVSVRVVESVKGGHAAGRLLKVVRLGGTVDGIGMRTFGEASFVDGEQALLFLAARPPVRVGLSTAAGAGPAVAENACAATVGAAESGGTYRVLGMAQGKLTVFRADDRGRPGEHGQAMVRADLSGLGLVDDASGQSAAVPAGAATAGTARPLSLVLAQVRALAAGPSPPPGRGLAAPGVGGGR